MQFFSRLKSFRSTRTHGILATAIAIGLVAAFAAKSYLSHRVADIEARAKGKTVRVVVAKTDLAEGSVLSSDTAAVRQIPVEYAHSGAITPENFDRAEGETLAYPVKSGEMILWSLMETKKAPSFSTRVAVGHRALTVPVDEINSISGMLEPGDIIDLIVTLDHKGKKLTLPLLQAVEVMATGQRSVDDPKSGERREFTTVTLDTTPEQAQGVIVAREAGRVTALLRNPQDKQPLVKSRGDLASLLGFKEDETTNLSFPDAQVPVLYGGQNKFSDEQLNIAHGPRSASASQTPDNSQAQAANAGDSALEAGGTAAAPLPAALTAQAKARAP